jgi:hypothetical protein
MPGSETPAYKWDHWIPESGLQLIPLVGGFAMTTLTN